MAPGFDDLRRRVAALPTEAGEVWEGWLWTVHPHGGLPDEREPESSPCLAGWVSARTHEQLHWQVFNPKETPPLDALAASSMKFAEATGFRPETMVVARAVEAEHLQEVWGPLAPQIRVWRPRLAEEIAEEITESLLVEMVFPRPLDAPGLTVATYRSFAQAAEAFYAAGPWDHLGQDDVVEVEDTSANERWWLVLDPPPPRGTGPGVMFARSLAAFESRGGPAGQHFSREPLWSLRFDPQSEIPLADADLWREHRLALASPDAYPFLLRFTGDKPERPRADEMTSIATVLRGLAETSEDELDRGEWVKQVRAGSAARELQFSLPDLLEEEAAAQHDAEQAETFVRELMEKHGGPPPPNVLNDALDKLPPGVAQQLAVPRGLDPSDAAERANALAFQSVTARGRRRIKLLREATRLDPGHVEAWVLLATRAVTPERKTRLFQREIRRLRAGLKQRRRKRKARGRHANRHP